VTDLVSIAVLVLLKICGEIHARFSEINSETQFALQNLALMCPKRLKLDFVGIIVHHPLQHKVAIT
jgi:hypothetical protein